MTTVSSLSALDLVEINKGVVVINFTISLFSLFLRGVLVIVRSSLFFLLLRDVLVIVRSSKKEVCELTSWDCRSPKGRRRGGRSRRRRRCSRRKMRAEKG